MIAVSVKPCIVMCILPDAGAISTSAEFLSYVVAQMKQKNLDNVESAHGEHIL